MENNQFFDPYNFSSSQTQYQQPFTQSVTNDELQNIKPIPMTPTIFYEQQYWYYNYLTKMLEYKIKLKEYENLTNTKNC